MAESAMQDGAAPAGPVRPRHVAAVVAGNALEFYDFLTYGFFAAHIGRTLFPAGGASHGLLAALATFGAGFLMRPVGAAVIGRIGDRHGRRPAMLISFTLMGAAMVGLAVTPTYAAIGMGAPILAVLLRLLQGFALGGEVGPSTAFLVEAAPPGRRPLFVSFQYVGQHLAVTAAGAVGLLLTRLLSPQALEAYGWRIAFVAGVAIIPLGLLVRRSLPETLHAAGGGAGEAAAVPGAIWKLALIGGAIMTGGTTVTYVLNYMNTYATHTLGMSPMAGFAATVTQGVTGVAFAMIGALLAQRFGRKPVMLVPWTVLLLAALPLFTALVETRSVVVLLATTGLLTACLAMASTAGLTWLTESLPLAVRARATAVVYAIAISVFGGTTQFAVAWLSQLTGSTMVPAWYMTGGVLVGLVAMTLVRGPTARRP